MLPRFAGAHDRALCNCEGAIECVWPECNTEEHTKTKTKKKKKKMKKCGKEEVDDEKDEAEEVGERRGRTRVAGAHDRALCNCKGALDGVEAGDREQGEIEPFDRGV